MYIKELYILYHLLHNLSISILLKKKKIFFIQACRNLPLFVEFSRLHISELLQELLHAQQVFLYCYYQFPQFQIRLHQVRHHDDTQICRRGTANPVGRILYRKGQPFNGNHLRPCPMLENPELLPKMVADSGAHSTDLEAPESAEHLCAKCKEYAAHWKPQAEKLWAEDHS